MPVFGTTTEHYQTRSVMCFHNLQELALLGGVLLVSDLMACMSVPNLFGGGRGGGSRMEGWVTNTREGTSAHLGTTETKEL